MMTPIGPEEFETVWPRSKSLAPESAKARALLPMSGFKTPCRWKHGKPKDTCGGAQMVRYAVRRNAGFKVSCRCKDGTLYVFRYE